MSTKTDKRSNNTQDPNQYANALTRPQAADALGRGFGGAVKNYNANDFEQVVQNFNLSGQVVQLEPGQGVEGFLKGAGPTLTQNKINPETGRAEENPIETWAIEVEDGVTVYLMAAHQLGVPSEMESVKLRMVAWDAEYADYLAKDDHASIAAMDVRPTFKGELPPRVGKRVIIIRGTEKNTKNAHRVTQYVVGDEK